MQCKFGCVLWTFSAFLCTDSPGRTCVNMDDRVNPCVKRFIDCDRVCADFVKLDDAAPIHAPAYVSGGGGSVGMLRVMWPVSPVVLQSTKIHQWTFLGSVCMLQVMWP